uniref:Uncharacterized protein n=1 Tax=Amphiprion percula TaxID=161767 RepID=A0A3P8SRT7_AMPPE
MNDISVRKYFKKQNINLSTQLIKTVTKICRNKCNLAAHSRVSEGISSKSYRKSALVCKIRGQAACRNFQFIHFRLHFDVFRDILTFKLLFTLKFKV